MDEFVPKQGWLNHTSLLYVVQTSVLAKPELDNKISNKTLFALALIFILNHESWVARTS